MPWWGLFYSISCLALLLGINGGAGKGLTPAMKGHPYYKEEAIIKTFEFDGDVIDCVDIYKQPAFDYPLLKNHTIRMKPYSTPVDRATGHSEATSTVNGAVTTEDTHPRLFTDGCPKGSIPITRIPHVNGLSNTVGYSNNANASDLHTQRLGIKGKKVHYNREHEEYAYVELEASIDHKLYGANATFSVHRPTVEKVEYSLAHIRATSKDKATAVEAGWMVYPRIYGGDDKPRFFTSWTDNHNTGYYNFMRPGFVWTHRDIPLNTHLEQSQVTIEIYQGNRGDWWLKLGGEYVGHWPESIVPELAEGAHFFNFGGKILNMRTSGHHTTTQMGSGQLPGEGDHRRSAYVKKVVITETPPDGRHRTYTMPTAERAKHVVSHPNCYNLKIGNDEYLPARFYFNYGGHGRSATCP